MTKTVKTIGVKQMAAIKRTAQNVSASVIKRDKLAKQINILTAELEAVNQSINLQEQAIITMFGQPSHRIVKRITEDGKPAKYVPNEDIVHYNEEKKLYEFVEISFESDPQVESPTTQGMSTEKGLFDGVDLDIDLLPEDKDYPIY